MRIRKFQIRFYHIILVILGICVVFLVPRPRSMFRGTVQEVIDGDSVLLADGRAIHYRGIRAPLLPVSQQRVVAEPFAIEARDFNEQLTKGKAVELELDPQQQDFGKIDAYCFVMTNEGKVAANDEMVRAGLAYVDIENLSMADEHIDDLFSAQQKAQQLKRGLWRNMAVVQPHRVSRHIGEFLLVEGRVVNIVRTPRSLILKFHKRHKSYVHIVIPQSAMKNFERFHIDPAALYANKKIRVFGRVVEYSGPELRVIHPLQIEIIR